MKGEEILCGIAGWENGLAFGRKTRNMLAVCGKKHHVAASAGVLDGACFGQTHGVRR